MEHFRTNQQKLHKAFEESLGNNPLAKIAQQNLAMFKAAAAAFMPGGAGEDDGNKAEPAVTAATGKDELAALRAQMAEMQQKLDQLLGHIECDHFRGNMWAKDQETAYNHIIASGLPMIKTFRASPGTQFATRRADRDGWPQVIPPDIIDAHLTRPGYTEENFAKILNLFQSMYPDDNFDWMVEYRNEYVKLINQ
jgi:hypothetical protein